MSPGKISRRFLFRLAHSVCLNRRSCTKICNNSFCWNHRGNIVSTCCKALSPGLPMIQGSCSLTSNGKWKVLALAAKDRMISVPSIGDPFQAYEANDVFIIQLEYSFVSNPCNCWTLFKYRWNRSQRMPSCCSADTTWNPTPSSSKSTIKSCLKRLSASSRTILGKPFGRSICDIKTLVTFSPSKLSRNPTVANPVRLQRLVKAAC
jgi:hypothetical protein